jgi:hypothetical protein
MSIQATKTLIARQSFQADVIPEGPITKLPVELVEKCLFWTDIQGKENTRLVSRSWNTLTLTASKNPEQAELNNFIRVLTKNLVRKKHHRQIAHLVEIQDMLKSLACFLVTPAQTQRLFVFTKGCIIGVLKTLSSTRRDLLQTALGPQISTSLKPLFELAEMTLDEAIRTRNFQTFYTIFISHPVLSERSRGGFVIDAANAGQFLMLQVLLNSGKISIATRELALGYVVADDNEKCVQILLDRSSISVKGRGTLLDIATSQDRPASVRLLLTHGPITSVALDWAIENAMDRGNLELARFIRSSAQITS